MEKGKANFEDRGKEALSELMKKLDAIGKTQDPIKQMESYLSISTFLTSLLEEGYEEGYEEGKKDWVKHINKS